jgi:hypothetical protein
MGPNGFAEQMQAANEIKARTKSSYLPDPVVFKKGSVRVGSIHEEPTLLSFFFVFHFDDPGAGSGATGSAPNATHPDTSSPLFAPAATGSGKPITSARNFFEKVVANTAPEYAADKLARLNSFISILKKVNTEMPWFFQSVTGLELARQFNDEEPWRGVDKPKIEIECLEENIELTATKLMSLYRNIVWDDKRNIRIMPTNISKFTMDIYVTEVRTFQENTASPLLGSNRGTTAYSNLSNQSQDSRNVDKVYAQGFLDDNYTNIAVGKTKPVFAIRLKHCEFDMNSGQEAFAELSKNPEYKKPKIGIYYKVAETLWENGGPNLPLDKKLKETEIITNETPNITRNPFDVNDDTPKLAQALVNMGKDAADKAINSVGGALARLKNMTRLTTGNSVIGNAHGISLTGFAENIVGNVIPSTGSSSLGSLFLGNIYGINTTTTIGEAINIASINALGGLAALTGATTQATGDISPQNIYDNLNVGGGLVQPANISPANIYEGLNTSDSTPDGGNFDNVYGDTPAVDSTPDGNLNQNVYE